MLCKRNNIEKFTWSDTLPEVQLRKWMNLSRKRAWYALMLLCRKKYINVSVAFLFCSQKLKPEVELQLMLTSGDRSLADVACSKRPDSGERCEVKKTMKTTSPPPSLLFFRAPFYFAPLPTIWTPGTGYYRCRISFKLGQDSWENMRIVERI